MSSVVFNEHVKTSRYRVADILADSDGNFLKISDLGHQFLKGTKLFTRRMVFHENSEEGNWMGADWGTRYLMNSITASDKLSLKVFMLLMNVINELSWYINRDETTFDLLCILVGFL